MALPNKVLPGFSAVLYAQPTSTPTPLTTAQLSLVASVLPLLLAATLFLSRLFQLLVRMMLWRTLELLVRASLTKFPCKLLLPA